MNPEGFSLSKTVPASTELQTISADVNKDSVKSFTFLGRDVGRACLCAILGIGINRFRKALSMQPDLRIGANKSGQQKATYSVDAFLSVLYESVAETLPDRFVRTGRSAGQDDSDFDEKADQVDIEELKDWLDRPGKGPGWQLLDPSEKKVCKYLPPGTVSDLYEHYQATRHLFGAAVVSHSCCNVCFVYVEVAIETNSSCRLYPTVFLSGIQHSNEHTKTVGARSCASENPPCHWAFLSVVY